MPRAQASFASEPELEEKTAADCGVDLTPRLTIVGTAELASARRT